MTLKERFESIATAYVKAFCRKQGYYYDEDCWVNLEIGGVCCLCDYYFNFDDIRHDIDNKCRKGAIIAWYDYALTCYENDIAIMNYKSFLAGAPRHEFKN